MNERYGSTGSAMVPSGGYCRIAYEQSFVYEGNASVSGATWTTAECRAKLAKALG